MGSALVAQVVSDLRGFGLDGLVLRDLRIEHAQGVALESGLRVGVQLRLERPVVILQLLEIGWPALGVADGVQLEAQLLKADLLQPALGQLDHLGVKSRTGAADDFDVELKELAVSALLRLVMTEHRTDQVETGWLRTLVQAAFEVRAHDAGGCFRPKRQVLRASLLHPVELFRDGVGIRPVQPQPRLLDCVVRLADRAQHPVGDRPQMRPLPLELFGDQVAVSHCHISSLVVVIRLTSETRPM